MPQMPQMPRVSWVIVVAIASCYDGGAYENCALSCSMAGPSSCPGGAACNAGLCPTVAGSSCGAIADARPGDDGILFDGPLDVGATRIDAPMPSDAPPAQIDAPMVSTACGSGGHRVGSIVSFCFEGSGYGGDFSADVASPLTIIDVSQCTGPTLQSIQPSMGGAVCALVVNSFTASNTTITVKQSGSASVAFALIVRDTLDLGSGAVLTASSNGVVIGAGAIITTDNHCAAPATLRSPAGNGGAAGGSFGTAGGAGGSGDSGSNAGGMTGPMLSDNALHGGCPGGGSAGSFAAGGGAIYLAAGSGIHINGLVVAGGAGGPGSAAFTGGAGGGTGGMIVLEAPTYSGHGVLGANGGGGAEGGGTSPSHPGSPSTDVTQAAGGGAQGNGGTGGSGSLGSASGARGGDSTSSAAGGGGGGGGAGKILLIAGASSLGSESPYLSSPPGVFTTPP